MEPKIHPVFEAATGTWMYIVADETSKEAVIIDSVLDYDKETGSISTKSADGLIDIVNDYGYTVTRILETHVHADHLSASRYLQKRLEQATSHRPLVCIGKRVGAVQQTLGEIYKIPANEIEKARFDCTFDDDDQFFVGQIPAQVLHLPGHTPDHIGYMIGSNVFVGDSIFNPDVGSARCDFPGGNAEALYRTSQKLLSLPAHYRLFTGHDYPPDSRKGEGEIDPKPKAFATVQEQRERNKHLKEGTAQDEFVQWRKDRDSQLNDPKLMLQAMYVNLRGGRLPSGKLDGFPIDEKLLPEFLSRVA